MRIKGINEGFFVLLLLLSTLAFCMVLKSYYSSIFWESFWHCCFIRLKHGSGRGWGQKWSGGITDITDHLSDRLYTLCDCDEFTGL